MFSFCFCNVCLSLVGYFLAFSWRPYIVEVRYICPTSSKLKKRIQATPKSFCRVDISTQLRFNTISFVQECLVTEQHQQQAATVTTHRKVATSFFQAQLEPVFITGRNATWNRLPLPPPSTDRSPTVFHSIFFDLNHKSNILACT